ncbi:MAG: TIGR02266 family protein [Myxococcales bacterium]|nr:TIGR02266 family protein [Myxococcales bacterium]
MGLKLLLVTDGADLDLLAQEARKRGHTLLTASAAEGLAAALGETPDVVLVDEPASGGGEGELLEGLRANPTTAQTPILILARLEGSRARELSARHSGTGYFERPFVRQDVLRRVEAMASPATGGPQERRRASRFSAALEVEFAGAADFVREYAANISKGGVFVRTRCRFPLHSEVQLRIRLPDGQVLETAAEVVHLEESTEGGGLGLRFSSDDSAFKASLTAYLKSLLDV